MTAKRIYHFGDGAAEGSASMKSLLGGKGANLAEMAGLGLPIPPGFTITTEQCAEFYRAASATASHSETALPPELDSELPQAVARIENALKMQFGGDDFPLLVSVRSGARVSMPGMMDTVLNLGLNDRTVAALARATGDERFAWDAYRRFVQMFGDVVLGVRAASAIERDPFEEQLERLKEEVGLGAHGADSALTAEQLKTLVARYKAEVVKKTGRDFPSDPWEQLRAAIVAVFRSWHSARAVEYRRIYGYPDDWGTAVTVMAMVFGNMGDDSGTGVAFTRDANTGERHTMADYLANAQGEDVVAGIRTPGPLSRADRKAGDPPSLEELVPAAYRSLCEIFVRLEQHYRDMQDIEFTVQRGKLWILQTRTGKRSARAMVKIAVDFVRESMINRNEALSRQDPTKLNELLHPTVDVDEAARAGIHVIARGIGASPGGAVGRVVFTADEAAEAATKGDRVILVRIETSPEDIHGMKVSEGILTARGGMTSHAAVVGRGMGKCCVVGCGQLVVDYARAQFSVGGVVVKRGDVISLDGMRGEVYLGAAPLRLANPEESLATLLAWADDVRRLRVRANADTPSDAQIARNFGAEGIGLCRTEHMFFDPQRILVVREMIIADTDELRNRALAKLQPMQRADFSAIFRVMNGLPVTVRLLDPPLHEFLPRDDDEISEVARALDVPPGVVRRRLDELHESNPMLGHRGCRLAITFPEIYRMQVRAIAEATADCIQAGSTPVPEIMIPLVATAAELKLLRRQLESVVAEVAEARGIPIHAPIGTMIELPRACMTANEIAHHADFFSFGTNDLTQTALGISRDDAGHFLGAYLAAKIFPEDPFASIDRAGVGALMEIAIARGRSAKSGLKLGICGEHGGDPSSVEYCHQIGLDYVSCSPYRVVIARLAAARAAVDAAARG